MLEYNLLCCAVFEFEYFEEGVYGTRQTVILTYNFISTLVRQTALSLSIYHYKLQLCLHVLNFYIKSVGLLIIKILCKQKIVWFRYLVVFISTLLFWKRLPVLRVFFDINKAVQYRSNVKWRGPLSVLHVNDYRTMSSQWRTRTSH